MFLLLVCEDNQSAADVKTFIKSELNRYPSRLFYYNYMILIKYDGPVCSGLHSFTLYFNEKDTLRDTRLNTLFLPS